MSNKNTFHLGITMAGAVTTGFMDYLLEVLKIWQTQKDSIPSNFLIEEMSMSKDNFYNIQGDNSIHKYLRLKSDGKASIEYELREFLKLFYKGKNLIIKMPKKKIKSNTSKLAHDQKIIEALNNSNIITDNTDNYFTINKELVSKINKFIFQGRTFLEINRAYRNILSNY